MLGLVYIFISILVGYCFISICFPNYRKLTKKSFQGKDISLSPFLVVVPASYYAGTLLVTWTTYLIAYFNRNSKEPLFLANLIAILFFLLLFIIYIGLQLRGNVKGSIKNGKLNWIRGYIARGEGIFLLCLILFAILLIWTSFFIKGDKLYVGLTVFGDFSPHIGMIRSFSKGNNFPTWYSHFAGEDIRYHFMFLFMVGNLEYLGLPLDVAFNLPSILSLIGVFFLLYVLAVKISGKKIAGYLSCLFFVFRSSKSLFTYISQIPDGTSIIHTLLTNTNFIGNTPNEDWGLFNQNVYCNQRHLAFSMGVMLFVLLLYLPHLYEMFESLKEKLSIKAFILSKNVWKLEDLRLSLGAGLLLGMIAFWNGSVLIATLSMLFFVGVCCKNRSELLISAIIALILSLLQAHFFIKGSAVSPSFFYGFIAENKTIFGAIDYVIRLLGILPFILFAAFLIGEGIRRYIIFVFSVPFILAFNLSLTVDITVNHKFIIISVMLLGIFAADFLAGLLEKKDVIMKLGCILIITCLTATGIYDFYVLLKRNNPNNAIVLELNNSLTNWVIENSDSKDIFLTANYSLNPIVLGGGMLFQGWQYFGWSAGYDTPGRDVLVKEMYEAGTKEELISLVKENNIRFIVVDFDNRNSSEYTVNEENISSTFVSVYTEGFDDYKLTIYDTEILVTD